MHYNIDLFIFEYKNTYRNYYIEITTFKNWIANMEQLYEYCKLRNIYNHKSNVIKNLSKYGKQENDMNVEKVLFNMFLVHFITELSDPPLYTLSKHNNN